MQCCSVMVAQTCVVKLQFPIFSELRYEGCTTVSYCTIANTSCHVKMAKVHLTPYIIYISHIYYLYIVIVNKHLSYLILQKNIILI